jgi:hypothetical protein
MQGQDTYASSIFIVNGFESANESNGAGLPGPPRVERPMLLMLWFVLSDGLIFSCRAGLIAGPARRSGIVTVCTGVIPPKVVLLPPQNALAARRGDVEGRSLCLLDVIKDDVDAVLRSAGAGGLMGSGLGGGRTGELARPAALRRAFFSALISCCSAAFSDLVEPSSERIASMSWSRSATSPSRVVIYSDHIGHVQRLNFYKGLPRGGREYSPLRRLRKLRALILLRSWRFSLLDIFWYSSGVGRQSSWGLSSGSTFTTALIWAFFWIPPE